MPYVRAGGLVETTKQLSNYNIDSDHTEQP